MIHGWNLEPGKMLENAGCRWMVMHEVHWSISPSVTLPWLTRFYPWWITLVKQQREDRPGVSSLIKNELNYSEPPYQTSLPDLSLSIRFLLDLMYDKCFLLASCCGKGSFMLIWQEESWVHHACLFLAFKLKELKASERNEAERIDFKFPFKQATDTI